MQTNFYYPSTSPLSFVVAWVIHFNIGKFSKKISLSIVKQQKVPRKPFTYAKDWPISNKKCIIFNRIVNEKWERFIKFIKVASVYRKY